VSTFFSNPFRPGAGHSPPYLAGRVTERNEFQRLLEQEVILENLVLTGLRGVGKTVLLDSLRPLAQAKGWVVVGSDISEAASLSEERLAMRILTDLAGFSASLVYNRVKSPEIGFVPDREEREINLTYETLLAIYSHTPGLVSDKLKGVLMAVHHALPQAEGVRGVVFAYDEAQNLSDHAPKEEFPTSLLLDVFQSLQKQGVRFLLVLVGLPTLFPRLVDSRTFAERMFRVVNLDRLNVTDSRSAILKPIDNEPCPVRLNEESVMLIVEISAGYPYFLQFVCREAYDQFVLGRVSIPREEILQKLDTDFFAGRWAKATDRQRDLLTSIAQLPNCDGEFSVSEIVAASKSHHAKSFSPSHVSQMLTALFTSGLIYRNRHGKYSFAVPLMGRFIRRQELDGPW